MRFIPLRMAVANDFVSRYHRHNGKVDHRAHRFSIGLLNDNGELIGVAIAGLPIAQKEDDGKTLEILRVCVKDGYQNANSMLYARVKRIGLLMGYERIITYTLQSESGSSLRAVKATLLTKIDRPSHWNRPNRPRVEQTVSYLPKQKWLLAGGED